MTKIEKEDKYIIKILTQPIIEKSNRKLCQCGLLQTHKLIWCHECGGKFEIDPNKFTLCEIIEMGCTNNPYKRKGMRGYRWYEALYRHRIGMGEIELKRFRRLCFKALEIIRRVKEESDGQ